MHTPPLPQSKSLLLIPPAYKSISLQMPSKIISKETYSIKIFVSVHFHERSLGQKPGDTPLHGGRGWGGGKGDA